VIKALETIAKWIAKLQQLVPASPDPDLALASLSLEPEPFPRQRLAKQGTKRRQVQIDAVNQVEA
jgi:hypothetical protein